MPVPGATITATQGDKSFVTSTDDSGAYSFPNLPDGIWTLRISMLGFSPVTRDIGVAPEAPSPNWDLAVLTLDALRNQLKPAAPAGPTPAAPAASTPKPGAAIPAPTQAAAARPAAGSQPAGGGRGNWGAGRPSLRQGTQQGGGFQRLDVNESANASLENGGGESAVAMEPGDVTQSSDAYVVSGSLNNGLNTPQQNDWGFGGPGGMNGMGGPGGINGMGGPGGPGGIGIGGGPAAAGGGPGGPGGGFGGGPGGGFGGRGGGGGYGGNYAGGRGGRGGQGGRGGNQASFGNGRRNPR